MENLEINCNNCDWCEELILICDSELMRQLHYNS